MTPGERLETFRAEASGLASEILASLAPAQRDAVTAAIAGGATLRLACDLAPAFGATLYLAGGPGEERAYVRIASTETPAVERDQLN